MICPLCAALNHPRAAMCMACGGPLLGGRRSVGRTAVGFYPFVHLANARQDATDLERCLRFPGPAGCEGWAGGTAPDRAGRRVRGVG
jgi:hypothetical protein